MRPFGILKSCLILCSFGCSSSAEAPPVFGGQGAQVENPGEVPLEDGQGEVDSGPCAKPAPVSDNPMFEDFEDADNHLFKVLDRDGWWWAAADDTPGTLHPAREQFKPEQLPAAEATSNNRYAAHLAASGFTDWGAVWGTTLEWKQEGVKCPMNASAFAGVRLRARGQGRIRLNFGTPDTVPPEQGGKCKQGCWDTHSKIIELTPEWVQYDIPFDKLQQGGWGTQSRFQAERLLSLNFSANPESQPVDFWVDDLAWLTAADLAAPVSSPPAVASTAASVSPAPSLTAPSSPASPPAKAAPTPAQPVPTPAQPVPTPAK
jgi:hypothetical protein